VAGNGERGGEEKGTCQHGLKTVPTKFLKVALVGTRFLLHYHENSKVLLKSQTQKCFEYLISRHHQKSIQQR
jgi:hypothetical protein